MPPLLLLFLTFTVLLVCSVPIAFALGLASLVVILVEQIPPTVLAQRMFSGLNSFTLLALPFFFLAGNLMSAGTVSERLIRLAMALVGHIRGGLALVTVVVGMFFAGVTGSSTAEAAGLGAVFVPAMRRRGYDERFAVSITAVASTMGVIIPPSILMVVYGSAANVSVGRLLIGGIVPGVLIALALLAEAYLFAVRLGYPREMERWAGMRGIWQGLRASSWALVMPLIIVGGMVGGVFTPTESAVVAVIYAVFISLSVYRDISLSHLLTVLYETGIQTCLVLFCIATASVFAWLLAYYRVPVFAKNAILSITQDPLVILLLIILLYLILGTFLDAIPAIVIFVPMLQPVAKAAGIDDLHLGVIVVMTCAIGLLTLPYGTCTLATCAVANVRVTSVLGMLHVLMLAIFVVLALMLFFPKLILFLPDLLIPVS